MLEMALEIAWQRIHIKIYIHSRRKLVFLAKKRLHFHFHKKKYKNFHVTKKLKFSPQRIN